MKKSMYLVIVVAIFAFTACGGGTTTEKEIIFCAVDNCQKACCLGCKATEGDAKCIVLADGSMPCCVPDDPSSEEETYDNDESHGHKH